MDFNEKLHAARGEYLKAMPQTGGPILSAGCAGTWYFEWIAATYGHRGRHIGIEFYSPKPDDLPENVEWIANTIGAMNGVRDEEVALVFSGQNIEHLWQEDMLGFFCESWRVLRPGGRLVLDSPNRLITEPCNWTHPEHTIELTPTEAAELAHAAGFEVTQLKGLCLSRDPATRKLFPHLPNQAYTDLAPSDRWMRPSDADHCFVWWLEAQKTTKPPDAEQLTYLIQDAFRRARPERWRRYVLPQDPKVQCLTRDGRRFARSQSDYAGVVVYGPYVPLKRGAFRATIELETDGAAPNETVAHLDVFGSARGVLAAVSVTPRALQELGNVVAMDFSLDDLEFGMQFRCFATGKASVTVALPASIERKGPPESDGFGL